MKNFLSPKELAQAIGVSESSLKRWADGGRIHVSRTAGGHRRIAMAEAIRFIRESHTPVVQPEVLGFVELVGLDEATDAGDESTRLRAYLEQGQHSEARGLVLSLYLGGWSVAEIIDGPLHDAMSHIGKLWIDGDLGIAVEHRATDICMSALRQIQSILPADPEAPVAIGGAPETDPGALASLAAAVVLEAEGFRVVNLGGATPWHVLQEAAERYAARLIWVSVVHPEQLAEIERSIGRLAEGLASRGVHLAIGGRRLNTTNLPPYPHVYYGHTLAELGAFARGLIRAHAAEADRPAAQ